MRVLAAIGRGPLGCLAASLPLAACDSAPHAPTPAAIQVVSAKAAAARPAAVPSPTAATPAPVPTPATRVSSLADMRPTKAFVDPPLPPELRDDGGLRPLPPPPHT